MKLLHLETMVTTVFGKFDDEGDLLEKKPFQIQLPKLSEENAKEAFKVMKEQKDSLKGTHLESTASTLFAWVDEDGDVVQKHPLQVQVGKLTEENFLSAVKQLLEAKEKIKSEAKAEAK